jgi:nitrogen regulatory protein PII 2
VEEAIAQLGNGPKLVPKRLLLVVAPDHLVKTVVDTLIEVNKTGNPGDGKIFVLPALDSGRIRTGEFGDAVLDE